MFRGILAHKSLVSTSVKSKALHTSAISHAASFFNMPAMSPTMTEGGVVDWKFQVGQSYKSGDVLLEVETDKATIDVEAVDDGILVKVLEQNGAKNIPVNKPIAIIAEPEDDINSLELPKVQETAAPSPEKSESSNEPVKAAAKAAEKPVAETKSKTETESQSLASSSSSNADPSQRLFPSVEVLLKLNNISHSDAISSIPATGPKGRLLKGDVLAYLGKISTESNSKIADYIKSKEHLDLSNIVLETPAEAKTDVSKVKSQKPEAVVIRRVFDLSVLYDLEKEVGKPIDLESFVNKASKKAETFAYSKQNKPKSDYYDEIFEDLIAPRTSVPRFAVSLTFKNTTAGRVKSNSRKQDIFDYLSGFESGTRSSAASSGIPEVEVSLKVDDKLIDSKEKVDSYFKKFNELLNPEFS